MEWHAVVSTWHQDAKGIRWRQIGLRPAAKGDLGTAL